MRRIWPTRRPGPCSWWADSVGRSAGRLACASPLAVALTLVACGGDEGEKVEDRSETADVGDLRDERVPLAIGPEQIGEEVAVSGEVTGVDGATFRLVTPRHPDSILVVHAFDDPPGEDTIVRVRGMLRDADPGVLEEDLGIDLPDAELTRYQGDLAISATAIDE